jgi:hypothetical protein
METLHHTPDLVQPGCPEVYECGCGHPECRLCADQDAEAHGFELGLRWALLPLEEPTDEERARLAAEWAEDLRRWRESIEADAAGRAALGDLDAVRALELDRLHQAEQADRAEAEASWHERGEVIRLGAGRLQAAYHVLPIEPGWHRVAFEIHGGDGPYVAAQHDNGIASCTCPGATLGGRQCKHLQGLVARGLMDTITGLEG